MRFLPEHARDDCGEHDAARRRVLDDIADSKSGKGRAFFFAGGLGDRRRHLRVKADEQCIGEVEELIRGVGRALGVRVRDSHR